MRRACLVAAMLAGIVGCGLSVTGVAPGPESQTDESRRGDGGGDDAIPLPPAPPCKRDTCGLLDAPEPFTRILYGASTDDCPTGFAAIDVTADPKAEPGACSCGACEMSASCDTGTIKSGFSNDGSCSTPGIEIPANGGQCLEMRGRCEGKNCMIHPPQPATTCSAPGIADRGKVTSRRARICAPTADSCAPAMCSPPGSSKTCLTTPGDVACPAAAPNKHLVGEEVDLSCAACTCTNTARCEGTMTFFLNEDCSGAAVNLRAGMCVGIGIDAYFNATRWSGRVVEGECADLEPGAATARVTRARTVCCP